MMKFKEILAAITMVIMIASCGTDDLEVIEPQSGLTGQWTATSFSTDIISEVGNETEMIITQSTALGNNFNYDLTIDDNAWHTIGSYETEVTSISDGMITGTDTVSYNNVEAQGAYFTNNNTILLEGNMFEYHMSGLGMTSINNENLSASYSVNPDGELVFTQEESAQSVMNGMTIRTTINSTSTWIRK